MCLRATACDCAGGFVRTPRRAAPLRPAAALLGLAVAVWLKVFKTQQHCTRIQEQRYFAYVCQQHRHSSTTAVLISVGSCILGLAAARIVKASRTDTLCLKSATL